MTRLGARTPMNPAAARTVDLVRLIRPVAAGTAAAEVVIGASGGGTTDGWAHWGVLAGACSIFSLVGLANAVNDVVDINTDAVNRNDRPLATGRVSIRTGWLLALTCGAAGVATAWSGPGGPWLATGLIVLSISYSYFLKSTVLVGNITVAALAAFPLTYGALIVHGSPLRTVLGSTLIFLFMLSYEVLKTIRDIDGDRASGCVTASTVLGQARTAQLFRLLFGLYAVAAILIPLAAGFPRTYFAVIVPGGMAPTALGVVVLPLRRSDDAVRRMLRIMTIAWIPGLAAIWVAMA
jgi:geranylgeranylglycerol-phosphate geranylgeranyltransferase